MVLDHEVANLFSTFCSFITSSSFQVGTSSHDTYTYRYWYISVKRYCRGTFMFQDLKYILEFLEQLAAFPQSACLQLSSSISKNPL